MKASEDGGNGMAEIITCPACQRKLQMSEADLGQAVQCAQCAHTFVGVPTAVFAPPLPVAPLTPRRHADEEFDARQLCRAEFEPHRGRLIKTLGVIGLVGGLLFMGLPLMIGPMAWVLASRDLRAMRDGHMDPRGEKQTRVGRWCGITATALLIVLVSMIALMFI